MTTLRVGQDKQYLSITHAYEDANNGDTILIDEGIYEEMLYFRDKVVNLIGNTDFPGERRVVITFDSNSTSNNKYYELPLQVHYVAPSPPIIMYVEGIVFESSSTGYEINLIRFCQDTTDTSLLDIIFNKCTFDASNGLDGNASYDPKVFKNMNSPSGYPLNSISFFNCRFLWDATDGLFSSNFDKIPQSTITKSEMSSLVFDDFIGRSPDLCVSGTVTSSGIIGTAENIFDNNTSTYADLALDAGWVGYQFTSPKLVSTMRVSGNGSGNYGFGFTLKASNTGNFSGEEAILFIDDLGMSASEKIYCMENNNTYLYIRLYNTGAYQPWRISNLDFSSNISNGRDYIEYSDIETHSYGPKFGGYINSVPITHCFSGIVSLNNIVTQREVRVFRDDNDEYLTSTVSSGDGSYYLETSFGGYSSLICFDNSALPDYNALIKSKSIPVQLEDTYVKYQSDSYTAKSIIIDIADNWGSTNYTGIRSIDFYNEDGKIIMGPAYCSCFSTTNYTATSTAIETFDTTNLKINNWPNNQWFTSRRNITNQRLICNFNSPRDITDIVINNSHFIGISVDIGARNVKIYGSTDDITSTVYGETISNSTLLFDGQLTEHALYNYVDNQVITVSGAHLPI